MITPTTTFWNSSDSAPAPQLQGSARADVAIIGGGFAGLSCARYLKGFAPALEIALLERRRIGFGASGRNGGILSPFIPVSWLIDCTANPQRLDDIRFAVRFVTGEIQALIHLIQRQEIDCDLHPSAIVTAGTNRFHQHILRALAERILLTGIPSQVQAHGSYVLDGYALQPVALIQGLAKHIRRLGIDIYEDTGVTKIRPAPSGVEVMTETGACLRAGKVILATNAYTHQLGLDFGQSIPKPVHTYLLATAPLGADLESSLGIGQCTMVDIGGQYFYARLYQNRLLFGGFDQSGSSTVELTDRAGSLLRRLRAAMTRRYPLLADVAIDALWGGPYHETRTQVPVIRPLRGMPDVILNIGYGGVGLTMTQFSGRLVAGLVLGKSHRDPDSDRMRAIYASARLPIREGLKMGWRLLLPQSRSSSRENARTRRI